MTRRRAGSTVVLLGLLGIGVLLAASYTSTTAVASSGPIRGNTQTAFSECQRTVARLINPPSDVRFAPGVSSAVTPVAGGWQFLSYADAEDRAGVATRVRWVCTADPLLNDTFSIHAQLLG